MEILLYREKGERIPEISESISGGSQRDEGEVLVYGGKIVEGPWHLASGGKTRSGKENFADNRYLYLESVQSSEDVQGKNYLKGFLFTEEELKEIFQNEDVDFMKLKVEAADGAGYVTEVSAGDYRIAGEALRAKLKLSSSCFTIQFLEGRIRFLCRGAGHGFGMSQSGAEAMAEEGEDYREILKRYFPSVEIIAKD